MFFAKSKKVNLKNTLIDEIVRAYFDIIITNNLCLSGKDISELLRCITCNVLNLSTKGYSYKIEKYTEQYKYFIIPIFNKYNVFNYTLEQKQGVLEALMHCMEMSRKKAGL